MPIFGDDSSDSCCGLCGIVLSKMPGMLCGFSSKALHKPKARTPILMGPSLYETSPRSKKASRADRDFKCATIPQRRGLFAKRPVPLVDLRMPGREVPDLNNVQVKRSVTGTVKMDTGNSSFYTKHGIVSVADSKNTSLKSTSSSTVKVKKMTKIYEGDTKFPKLEECHHFHYDFVELGNIQVELSSQEDQENINIHGSPPSRTNSISEDAAQERPPSPEDHLFSIQVTAEMRCWTIRRSLSNLRLFDRQLHRCIYDRKFSMLPDLDGLEVRSLDDIQDIRRIIGSYLHRFSSIAGNNINCGSVLSWLEMDNRGNHLMVTDDSAINTPAIAAAHVIKRYSARAPDEISFEVGDIISLIDMPPKEETMWWRGKRNFEVGFFPCDCVEVIGDTLPETMASKIPKTPPKPVLRKRGKLISFLRTFFTNRPARTQLKRTGIVKERVFGCDLGEHLLNSGLEVPLVLKVCAEAIEAHGIQDGIYRLSGVASNIQKLRNEFDEEREPQLTDDLYLQDIHSISSVLKAYFRELPNPLFTYQLYSKFAEAIQDEDNKLLRIHDVVQQLPPPHYRTAKYLLQHLARVGSHGVETGMHVKNLAIVWAPNLLRSKELEMECTSTAALQGVCVQAVVTEFLISYVDLLFSDQLNALNTGQPGATARRARPKSLAISTPTKLLSLEEARERALSTNLHHQKYIEVGGGPANLPETYHTIIDLPSKKKGRKGSKTSSGWKSLFSRSRSSSWRGDDSHNSSIEASSEFGPEPEPIALTEDDIARRRHLRSVRSFDSLLSGGAGSRLSAEVPGESTIMVNPYTDEYDGVRPKSSTLERSSSGSKRSNKRSISCDSEHSVQSVVSSSAPSAIEYVSPVEDPPMQQAPPPASPTSSPARVEYYNAHLADQPPQQFQYKVPSPRPQPREEYSLEDPPHIQESYSCSPPVDPKRHRSMECEEDFHPCPGPLPPKQRSTSPAASSKKKKKKKAPPPPPPEEISPSSESSLYLTKPDSLSPIGDILPMSLTESPGVKRRSLEGDLVIHGGGDEGQLTSSADDEVQPKRVSYEEDHVTHIVVDNHLEAPCSMEPPSPISDMDMASEMSKSLDSILRSASDVELYASNEEDYERLALRKQRAVDIESESTDQKVTSSEEVSDTLTGGGQLSSSPGVDSDLNEVNQRLTPPSYDQCIRYSSTSESEAVLKDDSSSRRLDSSCYSDITCLRDSEIDRHSPLHSTEDDSEFEYIKIGPEGFVHMEPAPSFETEGWKYPMHEPKSEPGRIVIRKPLHEIPLQVAQAEEVKTPARLVAGKPAAPAAPQLQSPAEEEGKPLHGDGYLADRSNSASPATVSESHMAKKKADVYGQLADVEVAEKVMTPDEYLTEKSCQSSMDRSLMFHMDDLSGNRSDSAEFLNMSYDSSEDVFDARKGGAQSSDSLEFLGTGSEGLKTPDHESLPSMPASCSVEDSGTDCTLSDHKEVEQPLESSPRKIRATPQRKKSVRELMSRFESSSTSQSPPSDTNEPKIPKPARRKNLPRKMEDSFQETEENSMEVSLAPKETAVSCPQLVLDDSSAIKVDFDLTDQNTPCSTSPNVLNKIKSFESQASSSQDFENAYSLDRKKRESATDSSRMKYKTESAPFPLNENNDSKSAPGSLRPVGERKVLIIEKTPSEPAKIKSPVEEEKPLTLAERMKQFESNTQQVKSQSRESSSQDSLLRKSNRLSSRMKIFQTEDSALTVKVEKPLEIDIKDEVVSPIKMEENVKLRSPRGAEDLKSGLKSPQGRFVTRPASTSKEDLSTLTLIQDGSDLSDQKMNSLRERRKRFEKKPSVDSGKASNEMSPSPEVLAPQPQPRSGNSKASSKLGVRDLSQMFERQVSDSTPTTGDSDSSYSGSLTRKVDDTEGSWSVAL